MLKSAISSNERPISAHKPRSPSGVLRLIVIGLISFLTLVDLFAAQAILPTLVRTYHTTPSMMGFSVNASTIGMAAAGILVALVSRHLDRRRGIWISLALLAIPTSLLASAPDIGWFMGLRIAQGLCMSTAFTLTMAYLAEQSSAEDAVGALAAYITGNVMSNLFGRVLSAAVTDHIGLHANFYVFALLNLSGAALVYFGLERTTPMKPMTRSMGNPLTVWRAHLGNPALRLTFGIGFLILFAFIGIFTYVNFVLAGTPISLSPMSLGLVYFVFVPAAVTTPLAGPVIRMIGVRPAFLGAIIVALAGLSLLLSSRLAPVLEGLILVGSGTFFAQAVATGFVARAAASDRASASGIYLACYYLGGIAGSAFLGFIFQHFGWGACVGWVAASLVLAALMGAGLKLPMAAQS